MGRREKDEARTREGETRGGGGETRGGRGGGKGANVERETVDKKGRLMRMGDEESEEEEGRVRRKN